MVCFSHNFRTFLFDCLFYAFLKNLGENKTNPDYRGMGRKWGYSQKQLDNTGGIFCKETKRQQPKSVKRCLEHKNRLHLLILHLKRLRASQLQYCFLTKALLSGSQLTLEKERHLLQLGSKILGFRQHQRPCEQKRRTIHYFQNFQDLMRKQHLYSCHLIF